MSRCFHCGLPASDSYSADIDGQYCEFCCISCQMVAQAIAAGGLSEFYQFRDTNNRKAESIQTNFQAYDLEEVQREFVTSLGSEMREAFLSIDGISCAACAWLIESRLKHFSAIKEISVNATNYRCRLVWNDSELKLSDVFSALANIGYHASPYLESSENAFRKKESRNALMRLGVAGIGMMQVGMYAIALHAGALQGMEEEWRAFFRFVSLLVATPVVFYSASSFFVNAWRALKHGHVNMDVPVSLAIGLAYCASIWATLGNTGEVYFDSISMFTFFLLLGRYLEMRIRHSSAFVAERLSTLLPLTVDKVVENELQAVPIKSLQPGDSISVASGEVIPCDGIVREGSSSADEAILTGESLRRDLVEGSKVFAGTTNGETRIVIEATASGSSTTLAGIEKLVDRALVEKPKIVALADRLSSYFVMFILVVATLVGMGWYLIDAGKAVWIVLSVLVATCPCALSLATPAALTAGTVAMRNAGLLVTSGQFIEKLNGINHIVFDKTGTLTEGKISISRVSVLEDMSEDRVLDIASALEAHSSHPIANAFHSIPHAANVTNVKTYPALGVQGELNGKLFSFGSKEFALPDSDIEYPGDGMWQLLAADNKPVAWILLEDKTREGIAPILAYSSQHTMETELLSGDRKANVERFATQFGLRAFFEATPEKKLERIQFLQSQNKRVLMVGDGINDVPVMSRADLSIAVGDTTKLAQTHADGVLLSGNLRVLPAAFEIANRVGAKIRQNLAWALMYNVSIIPFAAAGYVPPYAAAIGMSLSSLFVVLNAMRIQHKISA